MLIGLGCVNLGSASRSQTLRSQVRLVHAAFDAGITLFDTANAYGAGSSEFVLGRALRDRRDSATIATKVGYVFRERRPIERRLLPLAARLKALRRRGGSGAPANSGGPSSSYAQQDFSPASLRAAVDGSLRRLATDRLDVVQLHGPHETLPDALETLQDLVRAGKVRRVGVGAESVDDARRWLDVERLDVLQLPFGVLDPAGADVLDALSDRPTAAWVRGVLGGGVLAAAAKSDPMAQRDAKWPLIQELLDIARTSGTDVLGLATGFVRSNPNVDTVLLGMSTVNHVQRNLALFDAPPLAPETLDATNAALRRHLSQLEGS
jgi:aryl-alcohol dehydrogenase-like predicted oxidoreductase